MDQLNWIRIINDNDDSLQRVGKRCAKRLYEVALRSNVLEEYEENVTRVFDYMIFDEVPILVDIVDSAIVDGFDKRNIYDWLDKWWFIIETAIQLGCMGEIAHHVDYMLIEGRKYGWIRKSI